MTETALADTAALDLGLPWTNSFAALGPAFFTRLSATPLPQPYLVGANRALASRMGLADALFSAPGLVEAWAGNLPLAGADPLATVYSGHQFGVWAGQLGDGRALLLGEVRTPAGPQEIQLKGSGFYITDYKNKKAPEKSGASDTAPSKTESKTETKTEAKPAKAAADKKS